VLSMSTENAVGERSSTPKQARTSEPTTPPEPSSKGDGTQNSPPTPKLKDETKGDTQQEEGEADEGTTESGSLAEAASKPLVPARLLGEDSSRQVIAVSASKGPAAFFNLARKFLVTDEECDLSALEGAIVSAVDAAHLLERSKLATIVR
jgi:Mrp family chromosome partitioning ATPase